MSTIGSGVAPQDGPILDRARIAGMEPLLRPSDVEAITGVSEQTLANWRSQRVRLPFVRLSATLVRYRRDDVEAFITSRVVAVDPSSNA